MSYNIFETQCKNILKEKYPRFTWNKLSSQHHIDLLGIGMSIDSKMTNEATPTENQVVEPTIVLVEAKSTKKPKYYPFEDKKKRKQLEYYLHEAAIYQARGFLCRCFLVVKVNKKVHQIEFADLKDIPRSVQ